MADFAIAYGDEIRREGDAMDEEWIVRNGIQIQASRGFMLWGGGWVAAEDQPGGEVLAMQAGVGMIVKDQCGISHVLLMNMSQALYFAGNLMEAACRAFHAEPPAMPDEGGV